MQGQRLDRFSLCLLERVRCMSWCRYNIVMHVCGVEHNRQDTPSIKSFDTFVSTLTTANASYIESEMKVRAYWGM